MAMELIKDGIDSTGSGCGREDDCGIVLEAWDP